MNILVIGGTGFLGQHIVSAFLDSDHRVVLFNRGVTGTHPARRYENIKGNRDTDLERISGQSWDAIIDTCCYFPRQVSGLPGVSTSESAHYVLISSVNQYDNFPKPRIDENEASALPNFEGDAILSPDTYGSLKAGCEIEASRRFPGNLTVLRPGYIVGPGDNNPCLSYWVGRISLAGDILVPGHPDMPWQYIDARDLGTWIRTIVEKRILGTYNAVGPRNPTSIRDILTEIARVRNTDCRFIWVDPGFLACSDPAKDFIDLASWVTQSQYRWLYDVSNEKAFNSGLMLRPLASTVSDISHASQMHLAPDEFVFKRQNTEGSLLQAWFINQAVSDNTWLSQSHV